MSKTLKEQLEEEKAQLAKLTEENPELELPTEFQDDVEEDELNQALEDEDNAEQVDDQPIVEDKPNEQPAVNSFQPLQPMVQQNDNQMGYELRKLRDKVAELEQKKAEAPKEVKPAPAMPDPQEDPIGYQAWRADRLEEQLNETKQWKVQQEQQAELQRQKQEQEAVVQGAKQQYVQFHQQYAALNPDFNNAYSFAGNEIYTSFKKLHPSATHEQLQAATDQQLLQMAGSAFQQGYNPAQYIDHLARTTYGYQPQAAKPAEKPLPNLAKLAKNQRKAVGALGGTGGSRGMTLRDIDNLGPAELQRIKNEEPDEYRRLTRPSS